MGGGGEWGRQRREERREGRGYVRPWPGKGRKKESEVGGRLRAGKSRKVTEKEGQGVKE